ncbi:MAG TPA: phosphate ABC transporter substrate-binding protein PstS, partial [Microthrixaceae bacterium]|nr:phosphate ABC transporter substrate-binding protein PstS [Microthrixaceae bacterium]
MQTHERSSRMRLARMLVPVVLVAFFVASCSSTSDGSAEATDTTKKPAASADAPGDAEIKSLKARLSAGGASFPDSYYQAVNADLNKIAGTELVTYAKSGSSDGRSQLRAGTLNFAGSDSLPKPEEVYPGTLLLFPTVAAPITVSYNLNEVKELRLSADLIAGIFQAEITKWNDPKIAAENPDVTLPSTAISVVHRSDGSGTTNNFTKYLTAAAPSVWKLSSGDE